VLTTDVFHWYQRQEGSSLFGHLKGKVALDKITEITPIEDPEARKFEIKTDDGRRRWFQMESSDTSFLWVDALSRTADEIGTLRSGSIEPSMTSADEETEDEGLEGFRQPPMFRERTLDGLNFLQLDFVEPEVVLVSLGMLREGDSEMISERVIRKGIICWGTQLEVAVCKTGNEQLAIMTNAGEVGVMKVDELLQAAENFQPAKVPLIEGCIELNVSLEEGLLDEIRLPKQTTPRNTRNGFFGKLFSRGDDGLKITENNVEEDFGRNAFQRLNWRKSSSSMDKRNQVVLQLTLVAFHRDDSPSLVGLSSLPAIPQRFIDGCFQDMVEAKRRWAITYRWRKREKVDGVLYQPQPYFHLIKKHYPHFYCGRGKNGNIVYYESLGFVDFEPIFAEGATIDDMVQHTIFLSEYRWNITVSPDDTTSKTIAVIDVKNVKISDCGGNSLELLKKNSYISQNHYPETLQVVIIINCPTWFNLVWKVVKQFINDVTLEKIRIADEAHSLEALTEFIDPEQIPLEFGGTATYGDGSAESYRYQNPIEKALYDYVHLHNTENV